MRECRTSKCYLDNIIPSSPTHEGIDDNLPRHTRKQFEKAIRLWELKTGAETARLEGHGDLVYALALLPDGRLSSGSQDKPSMSDHGQLVPLIDGIEKNLGRKPKEASADAGYCSEANLQALADRDIGAYVATGRAKHPDDTKRGTGGPLTQAMRQKLKRAGYRSRYRLRKQIVEPVFGQIKQARGFAPSQFSDVYLFGNRECVVDLDAEVPHSAFNLRMSE